MKVDVSRTIWISVPGGISFCSWPTVGAHGVHDVDGVRLGLLGDVDGDGRLAVDERERPLLLDAVDDGGHVAERDRLAGAPA